MKSEHEVASYDAVEGLTERVAAYAAEGLAAGEHVLTIIRPAHRAAVDDLLADRGIDPHRARREQLLLTLDAEETLASLTVDGQLDAARFAAIMGAALSQAAVPRRVFGELVALLWERGDVGGALRLEELWESVAARDDVRVLCAYPACSLAAGLLGDVARLCQLHGLVSMTDDGPRPVRVPHDLVSAETEVHLPVPASVTSVRRFVGGALMAWGLPDLVGDAVLVTSELATNAVTHASSPFRATVSRRDGAVRLSVEDASFEWPERHLALPGDQDGRGMAIIAALAARSGCDRTPHGKIAWAELSVSGLSP